MDERSSGQASPGHGNGGRSVQGVPIWRNVEEWLLLFGVSVVEGAQLVPEEEGKDGVGT